MDLIDFLGRNVKLVSTASYTSMKAFLRAAGGTRGSVNVSTPLLILQNWIFIAYFLTF